MKKITLLVLALALAWTVRQSHSRPSPTQKVGPLPGGGFLLDSGWIIRPAGDQIPVDTFPMSTALSNNGKYLLVLNGGYNPPSISVIDLAQKKEIGRTPLTDAWLGLTVAANKDLVYVGGGSTGKVFELSLNSATGELTRTREFAAVKDLSHKSEALIGDVELSSDARQLYAADLYGDSIAVINLQTGALTDRWKTGRRPYRIVVMPGGRQLLVSSWADGAIYQHEVSNGTEIGKTRVGPHPTDMLL